MEERHLQLPMKLMKYDQKLQDETIQSVSFLPFPDLNDITQLNKYN